MALPEDFNLKQAYPSNVDAVCAIITTFRPDDNFSDRVKRVREQVGLTVIVDDGHSDANLQRLEHWFADVPNLVLRHNPRNLGIATSLNIGVSIAKAKGFQWILTLDDDSIILPNMVERLSRYLRCMDGARPVGAIGMARARMGEEAGNIDLLGDLKPWSKKRGIITSGSLMTTGIIDAVGPFRDEFFIDSVDYDFCLRARMKGFQVIQVNEIGFAHALGEPSAHKLFGKRVETYNYGTSRLYYQFRNTTVLAVEQLRWDPLYTLAVFFHQANTLFKVLMFENDPKGKFRIAFRGIIDGVCRRMGKRF